MEKFSGVSALEEQPLPKLPKIEYGKSLLSPKCPYTVNVDQQECAELLKFAGVRPNKLDSIAIELHRKPGSVLTFEKYSPTERRIRIYTDHWWKEQEKIIKKINKSPISELASGKKLSRYLAIAPPERAKKTVENLAKIAIAKKADTIFYHEAKHAGDHDKEGGWFQVKNWAIASLAIFASIKGAGVLIRHMYPNIALLEEGIMEGIEGLIVGYNAYYWLLSPTERNARKFEKELENSPRLFKLITIAPKQ